MTTDPLLSPHLLQQLRQSADEARSWLTRTDRAALMHVLGDDRSSPARTRTPPEKRDDGMTAFGRGVLAALLMHGGFTELLAFARGAHEVPLKMLVAEAHLLRGPTEQEAALGLLKELAEAGVADAAAALARHYEQTLDYPTSVLYAERARAAWPRATVRGPFGPSATQRYVELLLSGGGA